MNELYFVKPDVFIGNGESEENKKWTDRALMLEYGRIDSIEVEEELYGRWIQRIRARCFPSPPQFSPKVWHRSAPPMVPMESNRKAGKIPKNLSAGVKQPPDVGILQGLYWLAPLHLYEKP